MTNNRIRQMLTERGVSQADVATQMPDNIGKAGMSFIVTGKVLPSKDGMETLCKLLDCSPTDLYDPRDIDLLGREPEEEKDQAVATSGKSSSQHGDMNQLRVWLRPYEREAIESAVNALGYRSIAEWLREMIRNTVARNKRLHSKESAV